MKRVTIICPVYNEQQSIPLFYKKVREIMDSLKGRYSTNLLFMNNASTDESLPIIEGLMKADPDVYCITLSINRGYQISVEFGLKNAVGDLFMVVDVDCEDPPEMVNVFLEEHESGFDIVYGERVDREESAALKKARKLFYRLTRALSDENFLLDMAEFCLLTSEVRDAIAKDETSYPFIRASIGRIGFKIKGIPYRRHKRIAGKTNYNLYRMFHFAIAGILSSSTLPLRFLVYIFPIIFLINIAELICYLMTSELARVFEALFLNSLYMAFGTAFFCIYLARTYKNGLGRPNAHLIKRFSRLQSANS